MAYILGFFAADGYITVNKRGGQFWCIQINDLQLLEEIKRTIKSEHKISVKVKDKVHVSYRIQIGSIEMCDDLRRLGYSERKTKSLAVPNIPKDYFADFVRGYFDGDGNVWTGWIHKERRTQTLSIQSVFTSCSGKFLKQLKSRLESFYVDRGGLNKGQGNCYRLVYSILGSLKLYDFMYNELGTSKLFLRRKKDVFEKYVKMRL